MPVDVPFRRTVRTAFDAEPAVETLLIQRVGGVSKARRVEQRTRPSRSKVRGSDVPGAPFETTCDMADPATSIRRKRSESSCAISSAPSFTTARKFGTTVSYFR